MIGPQCRVAINQHAPVVIARIGLAHMGRVGTEKYHVSWLSDHGNRFMARWINQWSGTLVMIAQPAEEIGLGAQAMLAAMQYGPKAGRKQGGGKGTWKGGGGGGEAGGGKGRERWTDLATRWEN